MTKHQPMVAAIQLQLTLRPLFTEKLLHYYTRLTTWVNWYQKGKTSQDLNEARDGAMASTGPYANNRHLAADR